MAGASQNQNALNRLDNTFARRLRACIEDAPRAIGYDVVITSGFRTYAEQAALHAQNPSNARPGTSRHESGIAADVNLINRQTGQAVRKADSLAKWRATGWPALCAKHGLIWHGTFGSYHDPVHVELDTTFQDMAWNMGKVIGIVAVVVVLGISIYYLIDRFGEVKI